MCELDNLVDPGAVSAHVNVCILLFLSLVVNIVFPYNISLLENA